MLSVPNWHVADDLGHGKFASVYKCDSAAAEASYFALKVYEPESEGVWQQEVNVLKNELRDVRNVPVYVDHFSLDVLGGKKIMVVSPVGEPVLPIEGGKITHGGHWSNLVDVLHYVHQKGIAHRDVKPLNIYLHKNEIILNDWGSSCLLGSDVPFVGTVGYCYMDWKEGDVVPSVASDLVGLVRSVFSMMTRQVPPTYPEMVEDYWTKCFRSETYWVEAMNYAVEGNHDGLRSILSKLS